MRLPRIITCSRRLCLALLGLGLFGCGDSSGLVPVAGTVTLDDKPLPGAIVTFYPAPGTPGLGGGGITGLDGKYSLTPARGGGGLAPGEYVVTVNRPVRRDGSPPPPDVPPIESDARESLPAMYSSRSDTKLKAAVAKGTPGYDFALHTPGKK
jgi:hypothetical protein